MLYSFFLVILRRLNFIFRRFGTLCSIFIAGVSRNETVEVFIWENVWLENSLSQSDGGGEEGWVSEYRNRQWRARTTSGGQSKYVREKWRYIGARKGSRKMVEIKVPCFRWLSSFFKCMQKGFTGFA